MRVCRAAALSAVISILCLPAAAGQMPPAVRVHGDASAARDLLGAEMAFEQRSETAGPAAAMRDFMDEADGLSFSGGEPVRGAAAIFAAHGGDRPGGKLTWVPAEVFVDKAAEMGAVWGHFRFAPPVQGAPVVTGRYVTVWRRNAAGQWKGVIDIGNPD